jgi:histidyl-tRNA synthetase
MQALPGFRDFLPEDCARRNYIFARWREVARRYGFVEWEGPPLEATELYKKKSGAEIVEQLFNFTDKGEREVALRPELTPTLARVVAAHEREFKKPIKWFSIGQFFRHEKQQRGRLREFYQLNADVIGEQTSPSEGDAEVIALSIDVMRSFGFKENDFAVRVSSRDFWVLNFLKPRFGGVVPYVETQTAFFQILDKLEREPDERADQQLKHFNTSRAEVHGFIQETNAKFASGDIDFHDKDISLGHLYRLFRSLEARGLSRFAELDLTVVRGLAYYNSIIFELYSRSKSERAIAGGGRYDFLIHTLFGVNLTALGFAMGDVVLGNLIDDTPHAKAKRDAWLSRDRNIDIYIVIAKEQRRADALAQIQQLRDHGYRVDYPLTPTKVARQFQSAEDLGARVALLFGDEWPQVKIKNMGTGEQELVAHEGLLAHLQAQLTLSS